MTKIQITDEIRQNMNITLDTLRQIVDKDGCFDFSDLRQSGLSRVEVRQAIVFLNQAGHTIIKMRGGDFDYWCWTDVKWARRDLAKEAC